MLLLLPRAPPLVLQDALAKGQPVKDTQVRGGGGKEGQGRCPLPNSLTATRPLLGRAAGIECGAAAERGGTGAFQPGGVQGGAQPRDW